jgi:hypothetical protein
MQKFGELFEVRTAASSRISYKICTLFSGFLRTTIFNIPSSLRTDTENGIIGISYIFLLLGSF